jgi:hypothetical protein
VSNTPFDPRRLADLANRVGPAVHAPAPPVAQPGSRPASAGQPTPPPLDGAAGAGDPADRVLGDGADGGTGHPQVDAALAALDRAASLPPQDQIAAYESVHRTLQETLRSIEQN